MNKFYCPIHGIEMRCLLRFYVCDICEPPNNRSNIDYNKYEGGYWTPLLRENLQDPNVVGKKVKEINDLEQVFAINCYISKSLKKLEDGINNSFIVDSWVPVYIKGKIPNEEKIGEGSSAFSQFDISECIIVDVKDWLCI